MAHRDDSGLGAGANDNASGTAALIELARGYATPAGTAHAAHRPSAPADLPLHRRRRLRRARRRALRAALPGPEPGPRSRQPRLDRRQRKASPRAGSRPASLAGAGPGRERGRTAHRAERDRAGPDERTRTADRSRLPLQPLRAGAARRPRDSGDHDHDQREPPTGVVRGHAGAAAPEAGDGHRPRLAGAARLARRGHRARPRHAQLRLSRQPARPRLGDRVRTGGDAAAVRRRHGRPVRALPAAEDPRRARAARLPQPARLLALGRRDVPLPRPRRRLARRRPRARSTRRRIRPATGRHSA